MNMVQRTGPLSKTINKGSRRARLTSEDTKKARLKSNETQGTAELSKESKTVTLRQVKTVKSGDKTIIVKSEPPSSSDNEEKTTLKEKEKEKEREDKRRSSSRKHGFASAKTETKREEHKGQHTFGAAKTETGEKQDSEKKKKKSDTKKAEEEEVRKVTSEPIKKGLVEKVSNKLKERKTTAPQEEITRVTQDAKIELRMDREFRIPKKGKRKRPKKNVCIEEMTEDSKRETKAPPPAKSAVSTIESMERIADSDGKVLKEINNKTNDGNLFMANGMPHWVEPMAPPSPDAAEVDEAVHVTAEALSEVHEGKLRLLEMPTTQILMSVNLRLKQLMERDRTFFTPEMIYSNTVRSTIHLMEEHPHKKESKDKPKDSVDQTQAEDDVVTFNLPSKKQWYSYSRDDPIGSSKLRVITKEEEKTESAMEKSRM